MSVSECVRVSVKRDRRVNSLSLIKASQYIEGKASTVDNVRVGARLYTFTHTFTHTHVSACMDLTAHERSEVSMALQQLKPYRQGDETGRLNFIIDVAEQDHGMSAQTWFTAMMLFDRYVATVPEPASKMNLHETELLMLTCIFIGAKFHETTLPSTRNLLKSFHGFCEYKLHKKEMEVLGALDWRVHVASPWEHLGRIHEALTKLNCSFDWKPATGMLKIAFSNCIVHRWPSKTLACAVAFATLWRSSHELICLPTARLDAILRAGRGAGGDPGACTGEVERDAVVQCASELARAHLNNDLDAMAVGIAKNQISIRAWKKRKRGGAPAATRECKGAMPTTAWGLYCALESADGVPSPEAS